MFQMLTDVVVFCRCKVGAFVKHGSEFHECIILCLLLRWLEGGVMGRLFHKSSLLSIRWRKEQEACRMAMSEGALRRERL